MTAQNPPVYTVDQLAAAMPADSATLTVPVRVLGTIGTSSVERLFCPIARAALLGDWDNGNPLDCDYMDDWQCQLTGCAHPCLFCEPSDHPDWIELANQIALQDEAAAD